MTRKEKLLRKFLENPEGVHFGKIERIIRDFGFELKSVRGSHYRYVNDSMKLKLVIPLHHGECKKYYKVRIAKFIKKYFYE